MAIQASYKSPLINKKVGFFFSISAVKDERILAKKYYSFIVYTLMLRLASKNNKAH